MTMPEESPVSFRPDSGEDAPGLYLHIPFCRSKCSYCSFNSSPCQQPPGPYLAALRRQIDHWAESQWCGERTFATIFFGGGTPTIYDAASLGAVVRHCLERFSCDEAVEITVESNPNTIGLPFLQQLRRSGVNRLSIGVQSFVDRLLVTMGRGHTAAQARSAIRAARRAGFASINLDLIYGLPGQSLADWQQTLAMALEFCPEHLAAYELSVEESTPFARLLQEKTLLLPEEEEVAAMAEETRRMVEKAGLVRYEISNYARPGRECRHNINYWGNGSYLGLGAGAVSCLSGLRLRNVADPEQYVSLVQQGQAPFSEAECLPLGARFRESVIMGLRMSQGLSFSALRRRFGLTPPEYYGSILAELISQRLVVGSAGTLRLSRRGMDVANQVLAKLV